jgi:transcriptional regulator with XRE-family HTH domain
MGLKELRKKRGMTQKQLSDKLGWRNSRIVRLENLIIDMEKDWAEELAKFFEMDVNEFMKEFNNN